MRLVSTFNVRRGEIRRCGAKKNRRVSDRGPSVPTMADPTFAIAPPIKARIARQSTTGRGMEVSRLHGQHFLNPHFTLIISLFHGINRHLPQGNERLASCCYGRKRQDCHSMPAAIRMIILAPAKRLHFGTLLKPPDRGR